MLHVDFRGLDCHRAVNDDRDRRQDLALERTGEQIEQRLKQMVSVRSMTVTSTLARRSVFAAKSPPNPQPTITT